MLPELLFPVMQDISRDEFNLLGGDCGDRDTKLSCNNIESAIEQTKLSSSCTSSIEDLKSVSIKLEDVDNYSSWPVNDFGLNLLRNSDDPLISGARNDNQNDITTMEKTCDNNNSRNNIKTTTTATTEILPQVGRKKSTRVRRKGQVKLRFHHQALPQEYLDHYETTQNNLLLKKNNQQKSSQLLTNNNNSSNSKNSNMISLLESQNKQLLDEDPNNSVRNWLQKISELQDEEISLSLVKNENDIEISTSTPPPSSSSSSLLHQLPIRQQSPIVVASSTLKSAASTTTKSSRVYNYSDLPYMGEMTLENSKPRRGRKPKKADICHLIYKNYGQIFPGTPKHMKGNMDKQTITTTTTTPTNNNGGSDNVNKNNNNSTNEEKKSELQNKIISSLLEKRLTQNSNKRNSPKLTSNTVNNKESSKKSGTSLISQAEPLNLCLRDTKVRKIITRNNKNIILDRNQMAPLDISTDPILADELKIPLPNFHETINKSSLSPSNLNIPPKSEIDRGTPPEGFVYWPAASVFIHPMALYYQKLAEEGNINSLTPPPISSTPTPSNKSTNSNSTQSSVIVQPSLVSPSNTNKSNGSTKQTNLLVAKDINELMKRDKQIITPSTSSKCSETSSNSSKTILSAPQKRKRSAIFIPPMPSENSTNPTTEVSICKFKFTGGAKPSLQEKKMLSVDSGGNFRYYSGTGDKSMRGYEFFPRESLQQSSLMTGGSSSGAFLSTPGEKISIDEPYPSLDLTNDILQLPDFSPPIITEPISLSPTTILSSSSSTPVAPASNNPSSSSSPPTIISTKTTTPPITSSRSSLDRKKKKSRRSLQREKLEKTFKEKGFLIQTQQLESAEGATYCKFRQLTKFTRYLFRSWKDYLPGDLQQPGGNSLPMNALLPSTETPSSCVSVQSIAKNEK